MHILRERFAGALWKMGAELRGKGKAAKSRRRSRVWKSFYPNCPQNMQKRKTNIAQGSRKGLGALCSTLNVLQVQNTYFADVGAVWSRQSPTMRMSNVDGTYSTYSSYADRTESRAIGKKSNRKCCFFPDSKDPQRRHRVAKDGSGNVSVATLVQKI